jgi:hypothetical protein
MTIKMSGADVNEGSITCRLSNSILEKCIGVPPDQLRNLHRNEETRRMADNYINEGAKTALTCLKNLVSCNFCLSLSKDETLPSSIDGDHPVLELISYV